jgi:pSer/pThr/pTyr-binding forkhead associated (FHA) protein
MQRRSTIPRSPSDETTPVPVSIVGLAYLTLIQDENQRPRPINSATFRIGRLANNDLVIRDPSVSRHHAEIRRRRDGGFKVLDLNSMNGVFVNGTKIRESDLSQGDNLDVGDVRMVFSAENVDELTGENTVMLRTVAPVQPFPGAAKAASR